MKKSTIPCKQCPVLAACIHKESVICRALCNFMEPTYTNVNLYVKRVRIFEKLFDKGIIVVQKETGYISFTSYSLTEYYEGLKYSL